MVLGQPSWWRRHLGLDFLVDAGPVDGVAAFDSMVSAARNISARLGGEVVDEHGSTLSIQRERYLR